MPIRAKDLPAKLLRAGVDTPINLAFQSLAAQEKPHLWFLLIPLGTGYAVMGLVDLDQPTAPTDTRPLQALGLTPSPTIDASEDLERATELLSVTGYVVVLRDGEVLGVRAKRAGLLLGIDNPAIPKSATPARDLLQPVERRSDRYVNLDFTSAEQPGEPLKKQVALVGGEQYYFRLGIGELEKGSIESEATQLPDVLIGQDIQITVVLFSEDFTLEAESGVVHVPAEGPASVEQVASVPDGFDQTDPLLQERLLFGMRAPERDGQAELRCSLYCRGMLIQSRLITVIVGDSEPLDATGTMQRSVLDFNLSASLAPSLLGQMTEHKLSLMLNSNGDGSHSFRLVGTQGQEVFTNSATLSPTEIADLIKLTRERLRMVAWGKASEWDGDAYRYDHSVAADTRAKNFRSDLIAMARRGAMQYAAVITALAGSKNDAKALRQLMRTPGQVQMSSKITASDIVPIAMFYDHRIDSQGDLTICPAFEQSLASGKPLIDEPCFQGNCPHQDDLSIVCPSGFWGYRHDIGMPYPVRARGPELATSIQHSGTPLMDVAYFSDFPAVAGHLERLQTLGYQTERASPRKDVFALFGRTQPHVVYFYCHGVDSGSIPFIRVGAQSSEDYIATDNFSNYEIEWPGTRPLVIINGCHTTALTPEKALNFVRTFVEDVEVSGVIGTEITIFEPLAQEFAETFLTLFNAGTPLGLAVRTARLRMLAQQNPLGLVYMPHAYAGLKLVKSG